MTRMSTSVPQVMNQPSGRAGCGGVRKLMVPTAWRVASSRSATVSAAGGGMSAAGVGGVEAVQAEQGVEVDRAAGLVFGGLAV